MLTGPRFLFVRAIDIPLPFQLGLFAGFPSSFDLHLTRASHRPLSEYSWLPKTGALSVDSNRLRYRRRLRRGRHGGQADTDRSSTHKSCGWSEYFGSLVWRELILFLVRTAGYVHKFIRFIGFPATDILKGKRILRGRSLADSIPFLFPHPRRPPPQQLVVPLPLVHGYRAQAI
jgi:hypothetical protein